ncbi:glutamine--fructose-6-phosphate transaminase (isomerizing) [Chelatococcus reniformis]|uniref:Glutamine--fructose-6-phosphate aminotransferase [isomerizing] n=1 Tax=Chelatococcus reniformis TaxID=1494448 RepID=A0A916U255_9HYPH|nr:glutamine--fructose-6-phosphate transaminase (isomerizing) [Chelatococcus reniformis]GGC55528.1 glutamine--fructose-6-phosphate aminotransferase [isomerizing] [Chelatococcus reniformis]
MCGIIGILGKQDVAAQLVDALKRLEYRGYDSAGVATVQNGALGRRRAEGKLRNLEARLGERPLPGATGIGHTRWATHGRPNESNAHPHATARLAVVHNGIIENFRELRAELEADGAAFESDTDTEVVVRLVDRELTRGKLPGEAVAAVLPRLRGAFALAFLFAGYDDLLIGARHGAPLAVGHGDGEMFLGSDALALAPFTDDILYLDEGDWVELDRQGAIIHDAGGFPVTRARQKIQPGAFLADKGNHRHFMAKEIHEQPEVVGRTIAHYVDMAALRVAFADPFPFDFKSLSRLTICACGTAYLAGYVARYWFEKLARLPVDIDVASEFRYREVPMTPGGLALFISQSGETADTLASLRYAKREGQHVLSVVNVATSTIARESDTTAATLAGPEIGVASTKAFTCQLAVLLALAVAAGRARGVLSADEERRIVEAMIGVPSLMTEALKREVDIEHLSRELAKASDVLYLGRGTSFPLALEGALKLKETSYIHAEGYAAGELKHGPIALVDEHMPVVVLAPPGELMEKTVSNIQEVAARGGRIILVGDARAAHEAALDTFATIEMPDVDPIVAPLVYALPVQLLAYHAAVFMGKDVDQPRNLAKSVTVE